jgi:DnaJ-class molecular chaperone
MTAKLQITRGDRLRLRFYVKCDQCSGRGKIRAHRCPICVGLGYVLNRAGQRRAQAVQDAWRELLQS